MKGEDRVESWTEDARPQRQVGAPVAPTVHALVETWATRAPESVAVRCGDEVLTHGELDRRAERLAHELRRHGVGAGTVVALVVERSVEMVVAMLGVLRAGGAYLPVDPAYPPERVGHLVGDSGSAVLVTHGALPRQAALAWYRGSIVRMDELDEDAAAETHHEGTTTGPDGLACVIYTSGSTAPPRGARISHRAVLHLVAGMNERLGPLPGRAMLALSSFGAAWSLPETLVPLGSGQRLVVATEEQRRDPGAIAGLVAAHGVTTLQLTPSWLRLLLADSAGLEALAAIRELVVGGEALPEQVLREVQGLGSARLFFAYGSAETTAWCAVKELTREPRPSLGTPLGSARILVLDSGLQPVPPGSTGELCIAGAGVADGYLGRPELGGECIVPDPQVPGGRLFRTGDLGRRLAGGELECLGRIAHQAEVGGARVETGDVEAALLALDGITEAVVVARRERGGAQALAAYYVDGLDQDPEQLRDALAEVLPEHLVPAYLTPLDELPLTPNGTVDRGALPEPLMFSMALYEPAADALEARLAELWCEVLGVPRSGVCDSFFDLGGQSLEALRLVSLIHGELGVELPLEAVFERPTVRGLAELVRGGNASRTGVIEAAADQELHPLSPAQQRIHARCLSEPKDTRLNLSRAFRLSGPLDRSRLDWCLQRLVERHEALRTSFEDVDGESMQRVHASVRLEIGWQQVDSGEAARVLAGRVRPFDLGRAPLLRLSLVRLGPVEHLLLVEVHSIVADELSILILATELARLYADGDVPPLRLRYTDYAAWQRERLASDRLRRQEAYWLHGFADGVPVLELPTDRPLPDQPGSGADRFDFRLDGDLVDALRQLAAHTGTTLYMVLLALYSALLGRHSRQDDVVVGSPAAGRPHQDLASVMGAFANTLAMRTRPVPDRSFSDHLAHVAEITLAALTNADYPFDALVERVGEREGAGGHPLFHTMLVMHERGHLERRFDGLVMRPDPVVGAAPRLHLVLQVCEASDGLACAFEYDAALFHAATVQRLAAHLEQLARSAAAAPETALAELPMLTSAEKHHLLVELGRIDSAAHPAAAQLAGLAGSPPAHVRALVLDDDLRLVPVGVPGELWLAGAAVASSDVIRNGLSCERLVDNPWVPGEPMLRTGDRARWCADGRLELLVRGGEGSSAALSGLR